MSERCSFRVNGGAPRVCAKALTEAGLPAGEARDVLSGERYAAEVREDERVAAGLGIHAVPFFVVDRRIGASGAQPPAVLLELLREAAAQQVPVDIVADGASCGPDGC